LACLSKTVHGYALALLAMAAISIRDLDDEVRERLRVQAAANGRSMEAEVRAILTEAVRPANEAGGLLASLLERIGKIGGVELDLPERATPARPARLGR
jgi:plasmid stability protein